MKTLKPFAFFILLAGVWFLCASDIAPDRYNGYIPYFMERSELEKSVFYLDGEREMIQPGKIWVRGDIIFVNERYKGVHVIDNSDPANPDPRGFIVCPGCLDMAVLDNFIYLDNAVDLVAFDMDAREESSRLKNYFPEPAAPDGQRYHESSNLILVGWKSSNPKNR